MPCFRFIGRGADSSVDVARERERRLLRADGHEVDGPSSTTEGAAADILLIEPGFSAPAELASIAGSARVLLRCRDGAGARTVVAEAEALEALLDRPVTIVPEHALARRQLRALCEGHRLSPADLGPLLDPAAAFDWPAPSAARPLRLAVLGAASVTSPALVAAPLDAAELVLLGTPPGPDGAALRLAVAAIERGAVLLATPPWRALLGKVAVVADRATLEVAARALAADRHQFRQRREAQFAAASDRFGEDVWLARLLALVPQPGQAAPRRHHATRALIADFSRRDETGFALALRIRSAGARGETVALLHLPDKRRRQLTINPLIDVCVRDGLACVVHPDRDCLEAPTVELHGGRELLAALEARRPRLVAGAMRLFPDDHATLPLATARRRQGQLYAAELRSGDPTDGAGDPVCPAAGNPRARRADLPPVLGFVAFSHAAAVAAVHALAAAGVPTAAKLRVLLAGDDVGDWPVLPGAGLEVVDADGADPLRFLGRLDALAVPTGDPAVSSPSLLRVARTLGLPVLCCPDADCAGTAPLALEQWPRRLRRLACRATASVPRPAARRPVRTEQRVLFVTANGVGLGHLTRLAAIARRLPEPLAPVFATMSQAISVLHAMGFHAELLTGYAGQRQGPWNLWLGRRMADLIDAHRPAAVVLDASNPYPGVLEAVLPRADLPLVWVRRGMWRADQSNEAFLQRTPAFDLVIEPADIAGAHDTGATAAERDGVLCVPPIGLLDEPDLFARREARAALGLDQERPAVLVQLGSGTTRDLVGLLDAVFRRLAMVPGLQVVNAEWLIAEDSLDYWPGVTRLHGFPIARYFNAFDFTISAAGYNSFNDVLRFGLPAVFIANDAAMMDDQGARAACAEAAEAAFDIRADQLEALDDCVAALLNPAVRQHLATNARQLAQPNGAAAAASAIARLIAGELVAQ